MEDGGGCWVNSWLPGNICVHVDVMLGRSCSLMLQNDLLLIERERKSKWKEWEKRGVGMQWEDKQVHWLYFQRNTEEKSRRGKQGQMERKRSDKE